ncbi:MAG: exosortase A [Herbaspirillum sp.]
MTSAGQILRNTNHQIAESSPIGRWRLTLLVIALLAPFFIYFGTAKSIVHIWDSSETFTHGYVILPISLWLIWRRRKTLPTEAIAPYWPGLLLLAVCGFGWLLADVASVQVVRQYAFVAMFPLIVLTILGPTFFRSIAFPLFFLLFAVPFGEIFIAPLIDFTANFTVAALQATGIPVLRNGPNFEIPSGSWSVVEACSGLRYLISSFTLGCLYAYLSYRSPIRRGLFVLVSIIVPIIANGLRAYMIVMIGHLSGMRLAVGVDHIIYGWLFFGLVIFIMLWIGNFWREDQNPNNLSSERNPAQSQTTPPNFTNVSPTIAASILVCLIIWPAYSLSINRAVFNPKAADLTGFSSPWKEAQPFTNWKPKFSPSNAELYRFFQNGNAPVGLSISYYRNQQGDSKLISSSNLLVTEKDPLWHRPKTSEHHEIVNGKEITIRESSIQGVAGSLMVWQWYWIDNRFVVNDYIAKLLQAKEMLALNGDDGASITIFTPYTSDPTVARTTLHNFLNANTRGLEDILSRNKQNN